MAAATTSSSRRPAPASRCGEWLEGHFEPLNHRPQAEVDAEGYALQAAYFLVADKLEVVLRHETFDPATSAADNETAIETVGLNYYIKGHDLKGMLNLLQVDDELQADTAAKVLVRLQVVFLIPTAESGDHPCAAFSSLYCFAVSA